MLVLGMLVIVLLVACFASVAIGARAVSLPTVFDALGNLGQPLSNDDWAVVHNRIPRTVTGLLVGACLGLAGTSMQGLTRNPLADPGLLGVNAGAALAIVSAVVFFGAVQPLSYVWFGFLGAAFAAVVVYSVASMGREGATPVKLALAGAALTAGLFSLLNALLVSNQDALTAFRNWQVGSLAGKDWEQILTLLPFMLAGVLLVLGTGRWLNGLALGDDLARGLGQNPALARGVSGLGVVLLCGSATALAGPIAFIGLVVPHLLRTLIGTDYRWLLPYAVLTAPIILLAADVLGRVVMLPGEVAAGILTVFIGGPMFIVLVRARGAVSL
ncbi:iron chelate uptake ABC transporter family permease subunit [Acaricomes phytoseiuli]|nr:iron chelate uptake ABC transporter family permease subunit [Acaricomes phytoseiuli]MCW1250487.1 iron chelate uptake ABC transporter family permease subunit [Acaricomes phytoseiuli]